MFPAENSAESHTAGSQAVGVRNLNAVLKRQTSVSGILFTLFKLKYLQQRNPQEPRNTGQIGTGQVEMEKTVTSSLFFWEGGGGGGSH